MISLKEAFGFAAEHIKDLYESAYDIRLEEISHANPVNGMNIEVTVSFLVPGATNPGGSVIGTFLAATASQARIFKKVIVDSESGAFISLKMMQ